MFFPRTTNLTASHSANIFPTDNHDTRPKFNISPLNNGAWKTILSYFECKNSGVFAVKLRGMITPQIFSFKLSPSSPFLSLRIWLPRTIVISHDSMPYDVPTLDPLGNLAIRVPMTEPMGRNGYIYPHVIFS